MKKISEMSPVWLKRMFILMRLENEALQKQLQKKENHQTDNQGVLNLK